MGVVDLGLASRHVVAVWSRHVPGCPVAGCRGGRTVRVHMANDAVHRVSHGEVEPSRTVRHHTGRLKRQRPG